MRSAAELALAGAVAVAGIGGMVYVLRRPTRDANQRERLRRGVIARRGRMGDGHVTDVSDEAVYYAYSVGGAHYTASQEISELRDSLPENLEWAIGPVTVKFLPGNPGNSIVVSEDWLGIRVCAAAGAVPSGLQAAHIPDGGPSELSTSRRVRL